MVLQIKKSILLSFSLILSLHSFEQSSFKIAYKHQFQRDSTKTLSNAYIRDATLIGNSISSIYIYNVGTEKLKDTTKVDFRNFQDLLNAANDGKITGSGKATISGGIPFDEFGDQIFFDKKSDSIYSRIKMIGQYVLIAEKFIKINWQILDDEKKIKGFNCKKATSIYRGRSYTAWFCPEIPIPEGPYKFKGLPGLILEVEDDRFHLKIQAEIIQYPILIQAPEFTAIGKPISFHEYLTFLGKENDAKIESFLAAEKNQPGYDLSDAKPMPIKKNSLCQIEITE